MKPVFRTSMAAILLALSAPARAEPAADPAPVAAAVADFLSALDRMDDARVRNSFTEDASVFFPGPPYPRERVEGREEAAGWFARLFASLRARGITSVGLQMKDLQVRRYGDTALATFHLAGDGAARRTLILRREDGVWRVAHLHGSNLPDPPPGD